MAKKILIAEDDRVLTEILVKRLQERGYETMVVKDGQELVDKIGDLNPDLLWLDLYMPVKGGVEALEELRAQDKWKDLPVLVVTNLEQDELITRSLKLGVLHYIVKTSAALEDILAKVDEALK